MKLFFLFVLIIGVSAETPVEYQVSNLQGFPSLGSGIADLINGIIKGLLDTLKSAIPEPINLPKLNISLAYDNIANGSFIIGDLVEIGARNFNASVVKANILKSTLNVVLDFPSINLNTNYFSDLLFGSILPMYGEGPANIRLKNLRLNLSSNYDLSVFKMKLKLKNTTILLTLEDAVFDIHGMINNEAFSILCSQILDDTVNVFINKHNVLISKIISPVIESVVNKALSGGGTKPTTQKPSTTFKPTTTKPRTTKPTTPKPTTKKATTAKPSETFEDIPMELEESESMELRRIFFEELMKHPQIAKYVSF